MAIQVALCHPGTGERVLHRDIGHDLAHRLVPVELAVLDQKAGRSRGKCLVDEPIAGSVSASTAASDRLSRRPAPSHRTALPSCPTWTAARTAPSVSNRVVAISRSSAASTWAVPAITSASPILEGPTGPGGRVALRFRCRRARHGGGRRSNRQTPAPRAAAGTRPRPGRTRRCLPAEAVADGHAGRQAPDGESARHRHPNGHQDDRRVATHPVGPPKGIRGLGHRPHHPPAATPSGGRPVVR